MPRSQQGCPNPSHRRNPANNSIANLAIVSLDCHSRVTGRRGLGRSYTPEEVRKYKAGWERYIRAIRQVRRPLVKRGNKELLSQIDVMVCEIIALNPKNVERAQELLDLLHEIHFYAGRSEITQNILRAYPKTPLCPFRGPGRVRDSMPYISSVRRSRVSRQRA